MKWRIIEPWRGAYLVQRKGGLFWVCAAYTAGFGRHFPTTFYSEDAAREAMDNAILDWGHKKRVVVEVFPSPTRQA